MNPWVRQMGPERLARAEEAFVTSTDPMVEEMRSVVGEDVHFGLWLLQADSILRARTGLTLFNMDGSLPWREWYDSAEHPGTAALNGLRSHRFSWMLFEDPDDPRPTPPSWLELP